MVPQEVTCCSECDCILDQIKYTCTTCGEKTPTSRATLIVAAAAAKGKGKNREPSTSPTRTILARSPGSSGSYSSTARVGYELCAACFEKVGVDHSSASSVNGPYSRILSPTPQERSRAQRSAPKREGQLRHVFLEQFWDVHGWQVLGAQLLSVTCTPVS